MVVDYNLNAAMKSLVLEDTWIPKRMKAIRFSLINLTGRIVERSRELLVRIAQGHPSFEVLLNARQRIMELAPSG